jgi:hypothetical protein
MKNNLVSAAIGLVVAAVLTGGVAWATIPGPGGVVDGCYQNSDGQLRVIDGATQTCRASETAITWNKLGQPGPKGATGDQGPQGPQGPPGRDGTDGHDGVSVTTAAESTGANCAAGGVQLTAVNGVSYVCNGRDGRDGVDGKDGTNGSPGPPGPPGSDGVSGYEIVRGASTAVPGLQRKTLLVSCPSGKRVLSGGFLGTGPLPYISAPWDPDFSIPIGSGSQGGGWVIEVLNTNFSTDFIRAYAVCATVS